MALLCCWWLAVLKLSVLPVADIRVDCMGNGTNCGPPSSPDGAALAGRSARRRGRRGPARRRPGPETASTGQAFAWRAGGARPRAGVHPAIGSL